ncbi:MAG TPA: efflux RND transporter permease subunit [Rhizomicrobium sp.]|jgi:CzcA family heavy metal efflux pump|nr:efflux RND transporter permease subunit [Rhizomicrobium sp.]
MTWIVRVALDRPYTFLVLAICILVFGPLAALRTPTDIFPNIGIPVVGTVIQYTGLSPAEVAGRLVTPLERSLPNAVSDIEHIESQSIASNGVIKIFFQPGVNIATAMAQVTGVAQNALRQMPPGTTPPFVVNYNASTVPVLQLALSSKTLSEQELQDLAQNGLRPGLVSVPGAAVPAPYGGKFRSVQVDLDPRAMQAHQVSATDVQNAIAGQTQIIPAGNIKIGSYQYVIQLNDAAQSIQSLNDMPIKATADGATVFMRDVAHVRDGSGPQSSIVHVDGGRAVLSTVLKNGSASTLDVVQGIKDALPLLRERLPSSLKIDLLNDQSIFVKAAISGVVREGALAALLTSLMILLFLGSWRSTLIIATSIPLSVLVALIGLWATGQSLNIMTLGGLALAVGILVDDATVTIENINWHLEHGKDVRTAILDGARQIVQPAFVALLCICVVFVPMLALGGVAGFLFVPMAMSVVFAMIGSFILSRTLVPTLSLYLLKPHLGGAHDADAADHAMHQAQGSHIFARLQRRFEAAFEVVREGYRNLLALALNYRRLFVTGFLAVIAVSFLLFPFLGSNFFPTVDTGQITLHVRPPVGTRLEDTTQQDAAIEAEIRRIIPRREVAAIVDNLGVPASSVNQIYANTGIIGTYDTDIFISLTDGHHPSPAYVKRMREDLPRAFPGTTFSFPPADIISQILNFGSPAPLDVQFTGVNHEATKAFAYKIMREMRRVPGIADARMQQSDETPQLNFTVDRTRVAQLGLQEKDVTSALATAVAGTNQTAPNFYLDPVSNISYGITAQAPEYKLNSLEALLNLPVTSPGAAPQVLGALGTITRTRSAAVVSQYNILPTTDLYATTQDRDLGAVAADVQKIMNRHRGEMPRGDTMVMRGQIVTMNTAFSGLGLGLIGAVLLIYLLIVVNFQSWLDPFVIVTALPAALAGIVWMLFATGTTLSVPALTGALMCMGVATANSILVVSFARERLAATGDPLRAAIEAGVTRFRPVLMTALAMIIGMLPMALAMGEGGEQNAPLGRAVIGGLVFATIATLMFVPVVFTIVHGRKQSQESPGEPHRQAGAPAGEIYA